MSETIPGHTRDLREASQQVFEAIWDGLWLNFGGHFGCQALPKSISTKDANMDAIWGDLGGLFGHLGWGEGGWGWFVG